jgi:O-methyltransferase
MIKSIVKSTLSRLGYTLVNTAKQQGPSDPDSKVAAGLPPSECYGVFNTGFPIFQPWLGYGDFVGAFDGVKERTLVSADRCYLLWKFAQHARQLPGDFIECGVFRGGTALLLSRTLQSAGNKLWLFDSFEGLSDASQEKGDFYQRGNFNETSFEGVSELLKPFSQTVELRKGWIPATFTGLEHLKFSLAHVDVDIYEPALACCEFIYPRLVPGGVMVFDDYGYPACRGERNAVDKFFADKRQPVISLPSGQALVIKT